MEYTQTAEPLNTELGATRDSGHGAVTMEGKGRGGQESD